MPVQVPSIKPDPEKANPKIGVGLVSFSKDSRYMATRNGETCFLKPSSDTNTAILKNAVRVQLYIPNPKGITDSPN